MLDVNLQHTAAAERLIAAALRGGRFDAVLTLGAVVAGPALEAIRSDHLCGRVTYGTFGLTPQVLNAVRTGQIAFAIDQQEYLQGYLPIVLLTQYHLYGVLPDRGKLTSTGAVFITRQNAAHVLELSNQGCAVTPMATLALQEERRSFQQRLERGTRQLRLGEEAARTAWCNHAGEVTDVVAGCEHDRRGLVVTGQEQRDFEPVHVRKLYVEQDDRRPEFLGDG